MKRIAIGVTAVVVILAAAIIPRLLKKEQFAQPVQDAVVEVTSPVYGDIAVRSAVVGTISAEESVSVSLKAGGDVTGVYVKAGDIVTEGQLLFDIDTKQVESAKNSLDSAELSLKQAREELSRQQVLYAGGGISEQAYEQYQDAVSSAEIAYDSAKTTYDNQLSYSQITAPISGTVEMVNIEKLESVQQGTVACVISGGGSRTVNFSVSERIAANLRVGDEMDVEKDGEHYYGAVTEVSSMADSSTGLYSIKATLYDTGDASRLSTGSMVKLNVTSESAENVLKVPVDAIYYDGGLSYVYTYDRDSSTLHKIQVETGIYDSEFMEIKSGITENDEVLITWSSELYDGVSVRLKENSDGSMSSTENLTENTETATENANIDAGGAAADEAVPGDAAVSEDTAEAAAGADTAAGDVSETDTEIENDDAATDEN